MPRTVALPVRGNDAGHLDMSLTDAQTRLLSYREQAPGQQEFKLIYDEDPWNLARNRCVAAGRPMRRRDRE